MKTIIEASSDFIIKSKFIENRKENVVQWVDKPGEKAYGKYRVDSISALITEYDQYGNSTGRLQQVYMTKDDLRRVLSQVEEIESKENVTGYPNDDLPF